MKMKRTPEAFVQLLGFTSFDTLKMSMNPFQQESKPLPREGLGVGYYFTGTFQLNHETTRFIE